MSDLVSSRRSANVSYTQIRVLKKSTAQQNSAMKLSCHCHFHNVWIFDTFSEEQPCWSHMLCLFAVSFAARSQQNSLCSEPSFHNHGRRTLCDLWKVWWCLSNSNGRSKQRHAGNGLCGVRRHLRRQSSSGSPFWIQCGWTILGSIVLQSGESWKESRGGGEAKGAGRVETESQREKGTNAILG